MNAQSQIPELKQIRIGRGIDNDLVLSFPNISRTHATITICGPTVYLIEDSDSKNGTYVNGERIKRKIIGDEDTLILATNEFQARDLIQSFIKLESKKHKSDPLDFTEEFAALKSIYEEFIENKKSAKDKEKSVRKWAVIAASTIGVGALIASGGGIAPLLASWGLSSAATTAAAGVAGPSITTAIVSTLSSTGLGMLIPTLASDMLSVEEKIEIFTKELKKVYRCPKCKRPFGTTDYEDLYAQKRCNNNCKAIWVK